MPVPSEDAQLGERIVNEGVEAKNTINNAFVRGVEDDDPRMLQYDQLKEIMRLYRNVIVLLKNNLRQ